MSRGYFEIGIYHPKTEINVGTLWRSAYQLGAAGIFTVGKRYSKQASDTIGAWKHLPMRHYSTIDELLAVRPYACQLIAVEMGGLPLSTFCHPERAIYLLGAEDHGLPDDILSKCDVTVSLDSVRQASYNVAVAGSLVAYDRAFTGKTFAWAKTIGAA